jgi:tRNA (cytidine/uridine-2'-O-)-methyltransferase
MSMSQIGAQAPAKVDLLRLALYQPDIPQNTGTVMRMCAGLGIPLDIIGPAGFDLSDRTLRRAGLDYLSHLQLARHSSFASFERILNERGSRLVLLTTRGETPYQLFEFQAGDVLMAGRESSGVPDDVHNRADVRIRVPMRQGMRSMNIAVTAALVLGEAMRQTGAFTSLA